MKTTKVLKVMLIVLILTLIGVIAGAGLYMRKQYEGVTYFDKTLINGTDVSGKTPDEVYEQMMKVYLSRTVAVIEKDEDALNGYLDEFGYTVDTEGLKESLQKAYQMQKNSFMTMVESLMSGNSFKITVNYHFDEDVFNQKVCLANLKEPRHSSVDAKMIYDQEKNEYRITQEAYGNEFPEEKLRTLVKENLDEFVKKDSSAYIETIDIPDDFYTVPSYTAEDITLNNTCNIYNRYCKSKITYVFGTETEIIDWNTIKDWVNIIDGEGVLDEEKIYNFVENLASRYNTRHYDRSFYTSYGEYITIPSSENDYGYTIYEDGEFSQLLLDIQSNTEIEREPVYYSTNPTYGTPYYLRRNGHDDLDGTYVEINLKAQHLWYYKNGGLIVESDFVSGSVAKKTETKTGAFPLAYKESPSVLVGADAANGYRTEVKYWMPFYDGQGLHDASWRSSFGGTIYQNYGSHGCVNLPEDAAAVIYNYIEAGTAIIIY